MNSGAELSTADGIGPVCCGIMNLGAAPMGLCAPDIRLSGRGRRMSLTK
jgi:hypothetical protein